MRDSFMPAADRAHDDYPGAPGGELRRKPSAGITVTVTQA